MLFFNDKLTDLKRKELVNNLKLAKKWNYWNLSLKLDDKLILMNSNETSFNSKHLAAKELKLSSKAISKFLNTIKTIKVCIFTVVKCKI